MKNRGYMYIILKTAKNYKKRFPITLPLKGGAAMNNAFVFYKDYFEQIKLMEKTNPELVKDLLLAIVNYGIYEEYDDSNPMVNMAMIPIVKGIDNAHNRYEDAVMNGKKGGRTQKVDPAMVYEKKIETGWTNKELAAFYKVSDRTISRYLKNFQMETQNIETEEKEFSF